MGGESPYGSYGAEVQLQDVNPCAGDLGHDGLPGLEPGGDVADGHDDVHAAQRQNTRRLQPDAARRTCAGSLRSASAIPSPQVQSQSPID